MLDLMEISLDALRGSFGFGVAGNFAGHLDQAGEARDFERVTPVAPEAPKGIFPWYVPQAGSADEVPGFLREFPLSTDTLQLPAETHGGHLQIEPEVGVLARVTYDEDGLVRTLRPYAIGAFNDCSIRREGATKISQKKNWGPASKGVAPSFFPVGDLSPDGPTAHFRLACFLRRGEETHVYGIDSPLPGYSYYGDELLTWLIDRLGRQTGSDDTPLEPVGAYLRAAGQPREVLIGIGATRYTPFGERNFLQAGDESIVVVYDGERATEADVETAAQHGHELELPGASVLRQRVIAG